MNFLLKHVIEGKIECTKDEVEDVRSYGMAVREREDEDY